MLPAAKPTSDPWRLGTGSLATVADGVRLVVQLRKKRQRGVDRCQYVLSLQACAWFDLER